MSSQNWYAQLNKPFFAPPAFLFGPVWTVLYIIIAISFGYVFYLYFKKKLEFKTALPFILNLIFNFLFTPIQFGLRNNVLALIDIILVLFTIVWIMKSIKKHAKWVYYAQIPYLIWVTFATILQISITILN